MQLACAYSCPVEIYRSHMQHDGDIVALAREWCRCSPYGREACQHPSDSWTTPSTHRISLQNLVGAKIYAGRSGKSIFLNGVNLSTMHERETCVYSVEVSAPSARAWHTCTHTRAPCSRINTLCKLPAEESLCTAQTL
jgi:hypothetical protein